MAAHPYSTRFCHGRGSSQNDVYIVPTGYRAIVKHVELTCYAAGVAETTLFVGGVVALAWAAPGAKTYRSAAVMLVAYAGEGIVLNNNAVDMSWHVAGYLLRDDGSAPRVAEHDLRQAADAA